MSENDLQELVNVPVEVKAFGRTYQIKTLTLGQSARALQYIGPFGYLLKAVAAFPRDKKGNIKATSEDMLDLAITALSISGDSVIGLISVATCEPIEWLDEQDPMDGLEILAAVLEKNLDFFSRQRIERAKSLFGKLQQAIPALGGNTATS